MINTSNDQNIKSQNIKITKYQITKYQKISKIQNIKSQIIKNHHNITSLLNLTNYNKLLYIYINTL